MRPSAFQPELHRHTVRLMNNGQADQPQAVRPGSETQEVAAKLASVSPAQRMCAEALAVNDGWLVAIVMGIQPSLQTTDNRG